MRQLSWRTLIPGSRWRERGPSERSGERFAAVDSAFARPPPSRPVRLLGWFLFFQKSFPRPREASALGAKPRRRTSSLRCKALSSAIGADQAPPPGKALSPWRLALAVVAGAISGVVPFNRPVLVFKGGTYKEKVSRSEFQNRPSSTICAKLSAPAKPFMKAIDGLMFCRLVQHR